MAEEAATVLLFSGVCGLAKLYFHLLVHPLLRPLVEMPTAALAGLPAQTVAAGEEERATTSLPMLVTVATAATAAREAEEAAKPTTGASLATGAMGLTGAQRSTLSLPLASMRELLAATPAAAEVEEGSTQMGVPRERMAPAAAAKQG